jgi:hypothetical protein
LIEVEGSKCYVAVKKAAMKAWMNENKGWERFKASLKLKPAIEEITIAHGLSYVIIWCIWYLDRYICDRHIYINRKERKCIFAPGDIFPLEMSISLTDQTIVHCWLKYQDFVFGSNFLFVICNRCVLKTIILVD